MRLNFEEMKKLENIKKRVEGKELLKMFEEGQLSIEEFSLLGKSTLEIKHVPFTHRQLSRLPVDEDEED